MSPFTDEIASSLSEIIGRLYINDIVANCTGETIKDCDLPMESDEPDGYFEDLPLVELPEEKIEESNVDLSDLPEIVVDSNPLCYSISIEMGALEKIRVTIPGLDGIDFILNPGNFELTLFFSDFVFLKAESTVALMIEFSSSFFKPMKKVADPSGSLKYATDETGQNLLADISEANIHIDRNGKVEIEGELGVQVSDPFMVGDTGIILEDVNMVLHLSGDGVPPEGATEGWKGLLIQTAKLSIPDVFEGAFNISGLRIGSGGVSGTIHTTFALSYDSDSATPFAGDMVSKVFGMPGGLEEISLSLQQNIPAGGAIRARVMLPFFEKTDKPLDIDIGLVTGGGVTAAVHSPAGVLLLTKPEILTLEVNTVRFSLQDGVASVSLAGRVTPLFGKAQGLEWPSFQVKALTIDSRGRASIDGGWIDLPEQKTMDFYGFTLEVSKIGFGSDDDGWRWIGFSGGLKLCEGLPMSGAVEGLRIYWKDGEYRLTFSGASLAFEIPGSIAFSGRVALIDDGPKHGFKGSGKLKIIPTGLEVSADVVIGKNDASPAYTYFFIYLDTQLPAGIPLFSTGAAIYGLAGLFAYNMKPDKGTNVSWYGWYKGESDTDVTNSESKIGVTSSDKWIDHRGSFALGAGVTLGTLVDDGYSVNARTVLVIVLPGPIIMIEGTAAFLNDRTSSDAGLFSALAVLDNRAGQFLLNMDATYDCPKSGDPNFKLVEAHAGAEAFFDFHNSNNWHLFVGQRDPREKRVRVKMLSLSESNFYLMLLPTQFEIGAWMGYDGKWRFGPLHLELQAWIEGYALVSWKPVQFKGGLTLLGRVGLKAFGAGLDISLGAHVEVEAPTPYRVFAELDVKMKLPWPLPAPKAHIELEWKKEGEPPPPILLSTVGIEHLKASEKWLLDRFPGDGADSLAQNPIVPLDAKPVLSFARPMVDAALIGLNPSGVVAPERVGDYEFQYRLVKVTLRRQPKTLSGGWSVVASRSVEDSDTDKNRFWGAWLAESGNLPIGDSSELSPMTKLMLFARSPFELARETSEDTYYDGFSDENPTYGITPVCPPRQKCFGFDDIIDKNGDKKEGAKTVSENIREIRRGDVLIVGKGIQVHQDPTNGHSYLLTKPGTGKTTAFIFPEPMRQVELQIGKSRATCSLYDGSQQVWEKDVFNGSASPQWVPPFPNDLTKDFNLLIVDGTLELYRLCYVTAREADRFVDEEKTANHAMSACDAYRELSDIEILLPNSLYELEVITETRRRHVDHGSWDLVETSIKKSHFRTADPPGICGPFDAGALTPKGEEHYPKRGPLRDLTPYVSKVMPDTRPTGETKMTPTGIAFYRSYDVGVEFNEPYVETMYMLAGKPLAIYLYDNNGQGLLAPDGEIAAAASTWLENSEQKRSRADREWQATAERAGACLQETQAALSAMSSEQSAGHPATYSKVPEIRLDLAPKQAGVWGGGADFVLKPNTLYRATVAAMVPQVVIPLDKEGKTMHVGGQLVYTQVAADGSNFLSVVEESYGQSEPGMKVISDGDQVIVTGYKASEAAQAVPVDHELVKSAVNEALGSGAPSSKPTPVYSWSFYTSRFTSFVHHIHSFVDAAWDLRKTLGAGAWTVPSEDDGKQAELDKLKKEIKDSTDLDKIYQQAVAYFGLQDRPLPERLEINVLQDNDDARYGFMIESPEPIAWETPGKQGRVTLDVQRSADPMESPEPAYGPVKLIGCCFTESWVEILIQTDLDLANTRIERIDAPNDNATLYYEFKADSKFRAGTVVRIHVGQQPGNYVPGVERRDVFGVSGDVLTDTGITLRVIDAGEREIHRRQFLPLSWVSRTFVLAPDADGTRTFVFLRDDAGAWVNQVPNGAYRFAWTFRRNVVGSDLPVLRRRGSTISEQASIEFNVASKVAIGL
jgi:hypothetical protein